VLVARLQPAVPHLQPAVLHLQPAVPLPQAAARRAPAARAHSIRRRPTPPGTRMLTAKSRRPSSTRVRVAVVAAVLAAAARLAPAAPAALHQRLLPRSKT
jgi:hypothetical protein